MKKRTKIVLLTIAIFLGIVSISAMLYYCPLAAFGLFFLAGSFIMATEIVR